MIKKNVLEETASFPKKVKYLGIVYKDRFKKIRKIVAEFNKFKKTYFVSVYPPRAAVIVYEKGKILLTRQYRLFSKDLSYEIPGGQADKKETPRKAALRECLEETGFACKKLKLLIAYEPDLENTVNPTYVFCSNKVEKKTNGKKFVWIALNNCLRMIKYGKIKDSLTIMAILAIKNKL